MAIEAVRAYFAQYGREGDVMEKELSSATVELAAQALGVEAARIAITLAFYGADGQALLIVCAGDAKIDNAKFKAKFGMKARMIAGEDVEKLTGHATGGVCPFSNPEGTQAYVDESLRRFETVFPACGSSHSMIELTCDELFTYAHANAWIDVCKGWQAEA